MAGDINVQVRADVARRTGYRCEKRFQLLRQYCLIHEDDVGFPHQIDPILSRKHGGSSDFENLAYACVFCNRQKGSDVAALNPKTGAAVRLFHPAVTDGRTISVSTQTALSLLQSAELQLSAYSA